MQTVRRSDARGLTHNYWLKSYHSFSFGEYFDRHNMHFGPLRVINEDFVAPDMGFPMHGHANMEIITYILSGSLAHKDSLGNGSTISPGEVQVMSAGKGILHSEYNPSKTDDVHLLQIWIMPSEEGGRAGYQQKTFAPQEYKDGWRLLVSPDAQDGSLKILQDARLYAAKPDAGSVLPFTRDPARKYWLQVAKGEVVVNGDRLLAGDALALANESGKADIEVGADAELLLFDLPAE